MKIESPSFTMEDVHAFMTSYLDRDRMVLADRLDNVSRRLSALGPRIRKESGEGQEWNAHEVLAHIAVVSKFYGVLVHRIAAGKVPDFDLLQAVNLRDAAGHEAAELEPAELLRAALADQERTASVLRSADPESLRRTARIDEHTTMSAEAVARLPLVTHLEMHLDQLEKMVG